MPPAGGPLTVGDAIARLLRGLGVQLVAGRPLGDLPHLPVGDPDLACLLADGAGRALGGWGAAFLDDGVLHLSCKPGGRAHPQGVSGVEEVATEIGLLHDHRHLPRTAALHLDCDLDAPATEVAIPRSDEGVVFTLHPSLAELRLGVLVGPGVSRGGYSAGLETLARSLGVAVFNTWGAKGVFRWDSPYHGGTVGLQARDLELAGLGDLDVLFTAGLDPDETPPQALEAFGALQIQDVEPWQLAALTHSWETTPGPPEGRTRAYAELAAVVTPLYESTAVPLSPARAALHLSGARPADGVVVAQPGQAGFWVARTFPTGETGSVVVPATVETGSAIAAAVAGAALGRPVVAVLDDLAEVDRVLIDLASALGLSVAAQVWSPGGPPITPDEHATLTVEQFTGGATGVVEVAVDTDAPGPLLDVAGPVVAWA